MNCPACGTVMIKAQATNFGEPYEYCRVCKKEMGELLKVHVGVDMGTLAGYEPLLTSELLHDAMWNWAKELAKTPTIPRPRTIDQFKVGQRVQHLEFPTAHLVAMEVDIENDIITVLDSYGFTGQYRSDVLTIYPEGAAPQQPVPASAP